MGSRELSKTYEPHEVEGRWYPVWLEKKYFHAEPTSRKPSFCIVIPPPNVTGILHMGHALNNTLQDILCRYKRMKGFNVLWMPGTDHAGIATQNVVEKDLASQGKKRQDLGREKFVERVWQWRQKHGSEIINQLKRLGASCDWDRERFTMDEGLSQAVQEAFTSLYKKGLIFRDKYLINWCPRCHTALSDLEVEYEEAKGHLWHLRYPFEKDPKKCIPHKEGLEYIIVATTRPETMLGDTAVAVHPKDERYQNLMGAFLILPLVHRKIPLIADYRVDQEFGSGAVKITPAHDMNDFMMGNDHKLERVNIFTEDAKMNENAIHFQGMDRNECRRKIVEELEEKGFLEKVEDHQHSVGHCYRCKTIVEPYLSTQWFVKVAPLAKKAIAAVQEASKEKGTRFHPEQWTKTYLNWMENIKDWCISRQIWWGHRIPAWYCEGDEGKACLLECKEPIVSKDPPQKCPHCGSKNLRQEEDVLDTWFSSALWPFSTLGWPDKTPELKTFYPTTVLVTGFDIIFFWVARMMMMGLEFMGKVPFRDVYIHALVRDAEGKKMSKSKGNVIDPLTMMQQYGTDAFRFTLAAMAAQGRDVKLSENIIEGYRNFCNKIWNAARFALMNLDEASLKAPLPDSKNLSAVDQWILFELNGTIQKVTSAIENYNFDVAAMEVYQFFWHDFCDWYVELAKYHLYEEEGEGKKRTQAVLRYVLDQSMRLLHPFMPFITEEIWQRLQTSKEKSLVISSFPEPVEGDFSPLARAMEEVIEIIDALRAIRGENHIPHSEKISVVLQCPDSRKTSSIQSLQHYIHHLAKVDALSIEKPGRKPPKSAHAVVSGSDVFVPLEGLVDIEKEMKRLDKEIKKLEGAMRGVDQKLSNQNFIQNAPDDVVEKERAKKDTMSAQIKKLRETHQSLGGNHA